MVRSYLEKLAASVWPEATVNDQGTILITHGSTLVLIGPTGAESEFIGCWAIVATNIPATPALYEWLNEQNGRSGQVKLTMVENTVQAVLYIPTDEINEVKLRYAVDVIGPFVDAIDDQLVATLGGRLSSPPSPTAQSDSAGST